MAQQTFEELVAAVKQAESRDKRYKDDGKTLTTSAKGALGEMQVMPKTSRDPGFGVTPAKDKSPDEIARVGVDYLQAMKQKYGDTEKALIAYNWGPGSTDKWLAAGADPKKLPAETKTYVERVKGFLGGNVSRETTVAKKEREPLPPSLPPMAQADIKTPAIKPEAAARVASLGPGYQAALALSFLAETDDEEDRKTTITQEYLAKAQEEEDDIAASAAIAKRQSNVFADLSNTTIRSPFAEPQQPVMMKDGGDVGDRLTPQQIERIAAQEAAEREAASTPAFIAQKSGIGRKAGPVSQALQSGQGQIEFLKGMTNVPQNILGAPMDISNMIAGVYGGGVEKPFMGSEYLKEKSRAAGLGFTLSTDPTLAAFYGAGDLGSNLVNPAGVARSGVKAAGAVAEKAGDAARDFQQYNRNLPAPGASYAVRNKGTPIAMTGIGMVDEAENLIKGVIASGRQPIESADKPLSNWFSKTVTRYLRSDFATPDDQLVKAAEKGQLLHVAPKQFSDSADDQILKDFLKRRQPDLAYMREAEMNTKTNMATQPYGQRIEDLTDISAYPERVGDLTPNRVPQGMRDIVETRPETRVTDYAPGIVQNLKLDELRDKMLEIRQSNSLYGAYGQPVVKIPEDYLLSDKKLTDLNVATASNRMALYTRWQDDTRQRMATTSLREDPRFTRAPLQEGKYLGVALPDVRQNPEVKQLVLDVGCDGGWCTRYSQNAKAYGSGDSRLHIMVTGEGKKARPVAQFAIADSGPAYDAGNRFSIREIKEKGNTTDFKNNPALPAIQEYVKFLDRSYGGLFYVDELAGLNMINMREELRFPSMPHSKGEYSSQGLLDKLLKVNGNSYYASKSEFSDLIKKANELPNNAARQIQMNLFGLPKEKATGGMIERQPNDNRRYM